MSPVTTAGELRNLPEDELAQKLAEAKQELFNLRFQAATGALENTTRLKLAKREIARILTVQHDRGSSVARTSTKQKVQS
jgi:large subunit ribosomal protein L29